MDNEQLNHDFDELIKEQLDNLPEERPPAADWEALRSELKKEGIIRDDSRWRKYLLFFLLPAMLIGGISVPLLMNRYSIDWNYFSQSENADNKKVIAQNSPDNTSAAVVASQRGNPEAADKLPAGNSSPLRSGDETSAENTPAAGVHLVALNAKKKIPGADHPGYDTGLMENENPAGGINENVIKQQAENKNADTGHDDSATGKQPAAVDSADDSPETPQAADNSAAKNLSDSVAAASPNLAAQADSAEAVKTLKDSLVKESRVNYVPWVGIYDSWDFTTYHLRQNSSYAGEANDVMNSADIDGINSLAQYTIGIMGGLRITPKVALEAGAFFSQKRKLSDVVSTEASANAGGAESFSDFAYHYNAKYIDVYGRMKYYFMEKKHSFYCTAGAVASFNFPSGKKDKGYFERTTFSEGAAPQTDRVTLEAKSAGMSIAVSAGMEWNLSERWNIFFEPAYRHALTPVVLHPDYEKLPVEHFWRTFSVATGLMYKF